jgi:MYXO-CTERM domain-containing protein
MLIVEIPPADAPMADVPIGEPEATPGAAPSQPLTLLLGGVGLAVLVGAATWRRKRWLLRHWQNLYERAR